MYHTHIHKMSVAHLNETYDVPEELLGFPRELLDMALGEHDYSNCEPIPQGSGIHVYVVVHAEHWFYAESTSKIEGIYSTMRNANIAALKLFKESYRDYMDNMGNTWKFDYTGGGTVWEVNKSHGGIYLETFDEGCDRRKGHILVTEHTITE